MLRGAVCFWCGESDCGEILLCDTCEKGFCALCITSHLGSATLEKIMATDPWSCFACDASALATLTTHFAATQQIEYFPPCVNETRKLLVEVENEFDMWDIKVAEESEETLKEIRTEMQSASEENNKYVNKTTHKQRVLPLFLSLHFIFLLSYMC